MSRRRNRQRFQQLLRELFQFDVSDLDFGIYRILNQRREEIERFIEQDLLEAVAEELEVLAKAGRAEVEHKLEEKREQLGEDAFEGDGSLKEGALTTKLGREYQALEEELEAVAVAEETEARIFNDLYRFFSRYYREGDFLTERRYSSGEPKYAVPYNGEEVLLHWANRDQYYVKTTERFSDYQFLVGEHRVVFQLQRAQTAQNDVRGETRYIVLAEEEPLGLYEDAGALKVRCAYRVLDESEEQGILGRYNENRSKSDRRKRLDRSIVVEVLAQEIFEWLAAHGATTLRAKLAAPEEEGKSHSRLETHLNRYTARHDMDYFVHKDLGGFLRRELDFFLKNEILDLDDFSGTLAAKDSDLEQAICRMQVIRRIADRIIVFVAQIEDFQKRLFEKKKFVVDTQYCVTIDKLPQDLYDDVLANRKQLEAWRELYAIDHWDEDLFHQGAEFNRTFLEAHPYLMIDTAHFEQSFTDRLLASFADLEEATDGLLIHGENFQALNLLQEKFQHSVDCVYIDPPYNTGPTEIIYKNNYKDSSWLSLMRDRLHLSKMLMRPDGVHAVAIDDYELAHLAELLDRLFAQHQRHVIVVNHHPQGSGGTNVSRTHEYALVLTPERESVLAGERLGSETEHRPFKRSGRGENNFRAGRPNSFYAILVEPKSTRVVGVEGPPELGEEYPTNSTAEGYKRVYPIGGDGAERVWRRSFETARELVKRGRLVSSDSYTIYLVIEHEDRHAPVYSNWTAKKYNAGTWGTNLIADILGRPGQFSYPKSLHTVKDMVGAVCADRPSSVIVDYFAGSGTTGHAVMSLNREDGGERKYILVEVGEYFDTVLKPRLVKTAFSSEWKDGIPQNQEGMSQLIKYQRLESYEDTLNNLELSRPGDVQMDLYSEFDDYLLEYMLDVESRDSPPLLDEETFEHPFEYRLKIQKGMESPQAMLVDLVETFHYLIGVEVKTRRVEEHQGRRYVVTLGRREIADGYERVLTIWRDREDLDLEKEAEWWEDLWDEGRPERIYTNGPSHIPDAQPLEIPFREAMMEAASDA